MDLPGKVDLQDTKFLVTSYLGVTISHLHSNDSNNTVTNEIEIMEVIFTLPSRSLDLQTVFFL